MTTSWWLIFSASAAVYLTIAAGASARWTRLLTTEADQSLLRLTVRLLFPCLIFSIIANSPALRAARNVALPPLVGYGTMALGFALAGLVSRLDRRWHGLGDRSERSTFAACVGIYNYGFIPIPLVQALFDRDTLGVFFVLYVGCDLAVWTLGVMLFSGGLGKYWWRQMINAPSITILIALIVNFLDAYRFLPTFCVRTLESLGQAGIPLSMLLIGAIIADELGARRRLRSAADSGKIIAWSLLLRLLILPALMLLLAWLLPGSIELKRVLVIQAAMPSGTFPIVMARHYGGSPGVALRVVLSTSLVSLATIPIWISLGLHLLHLGQ